MKEVAKDHNGLNSFFLPINIPNVDGSVCHDAILSLESQNHKSANILFVALKQKFDFGDLTSQNQARKIDS